MRHSAADLGSRLGAGGCATATMTTATTHDHDDHGHGHGHDERHRSRNIPRPRRAWSYTALPSLDPSSTIFPNPPRPDPARPITLPAATQLTSQLLQQMNAAMPPLICSPKPLDAMPQQPRIFL